MSGIDLESAELTAEGLKHDRRYMLIDEHGTFISQRKFPQLARFILKFSENGFNVEFDGEQIEIGFDQISDNKIEVQVWKDRFLATLAIDTVNDWFSDLLGMAVRLVHFGSDSYRVRNRNGHVFRTAFADGYPVLVCNESSLNSLQQTIGDDIAMDRFRPNIVVTGLEAFEELNGNFVIVRNSTSTVMKKCERCAVPTVDQQTGIRTGKEPIKTLTEMYSGTPVFGMSAAFEKAVTIKVGDEMVWDLSDQ